MPSCNHCCSGKAINITCSESVSVTLVFQHANRVLHFVVGVQSVSIFQHYFINDTIFWKGSFKINVFWLFLQVLSVTFLTLWRIQWDIKISAHMLLLKNPLFLTDFNGTWIFSKYFRKITKYQMPWISVQWYPSCSMRIYRPTDRETRRS